MSEKSDAYAGQGGSYTRDPKTGTRVLIERTELRENTTSAESEPPPTTDLSSEQPA